MKCLESISFIDFRKKSSEKEESDRRELAEKVVDLGTTDKGVGEVSTEHSKVAINEKVNRQSPLQSHGGKGKFIIWDLIKV